MTMIIKNEDICSVLIKYGVNDTITTELINIIRKYIEDYTKKDSNNQKMLDQIFHHLIKNNGVILSSIEEKAFQKELINIGKEVIRAHTKRDFLSEMLAESPPKATPLIPEANNTNSNSNTQDSSTADNYHQMQLILIQLGYNDFNERSINSILMYMQMFLDMAEKYHALDKKDDLILIQAKTIRRLRNKIGADFLRGKEQDFFKLVSKHIK